MMGSFMNSCQFKGLELSDSSPKTLLLDGWLTTQKNSVRAALLACLLVVGCAAGPGPDGSGSSAPMCLQASVPQMAPYFASARCSLYCPLPPMIPALP